MAEYRHQRLVDPKQNIRVVTILPGDFNDPIHITISQERLVEVEPLSSRPKLSLQELRQLLPKGWEVGETLDSRYIFRHPQTDLNTWTHPDPTVDPAGYMREKDPQSERAKPAYEALSYVWGSSEDPEWVVVVDRARLPITPNLAAAIRHLRYSDKTRTRTIWIDALCINQSDDEERSAQVARMGQIYSRATRVVAWLGPGSPLTNLALSKLEYLGHQVECSRDGFVWRHPDSQEEGWYGAEVPPFEREVWDAIAHLGGLPWFERLWVVQEIQLASHGSILKCGDAEISWSVFRRAVICLHWKDGLPQEACSQIANMVWNCKSFQDYGFDEILFEVGRRRRCKDDRDTVYGLLNMAPAELRQAVRTDYSLPVMSVSRDFFLTYNCLLSRIDLLRFCGRNRNTASHEDLNWPSWVPDWRPPGPELAVPLGQGHCASSVSGAAATLSDDNKLEIDALFITSIVKILGDEQMHAEQDTAHAESVDFPDSPELVAFSTTEGRLGASKCALRLGDQVFIVLGCDVPLILRPDTDEGTYKVLGDCYLSGAMDGEALLGELESPWAVEYVLEEDGERRTAYANAETDEKTSNDPRLGSTTPEWQPIAWVRTTADPYFCSKFRNTRTSEIINFHPQLFPNALRERCIDIMRVTLV
ncbi:HET-domain-containing protein [Astrocystis sublimbata]|nr:HET-domain-containing protein [Astrocystis sublimbata]